MFANHKQGKSYMQNPLSLEGEGKGEGEILAKGDNPVPSCPQLIQFANTLKDSTKQGVDER